MKPLFDSFRLHLWQLLLVAMGACAAGAGLASNSRLVTEATAASPILLATADTNRFFPVSTISTPDSLISKGYSGHTRQSARRRLEGGQSRHCAAARLQTRAPDSWRSADGPGTPPGWHRRRGQGTQPVLDRLARRSQGAAAALYRPACPRPVAAPDSPARCPVRNTRCWPTPRVPGCICSKT